MAMPIFPIQSPEKPKATYFVEQDVYGYDHAIVYNETIKTSTNRVVNTDISALTQDLHSPQALDFAAQSVEED